MATNNGDHHGTLGIDRMASGDEIKMGYRRQAKRFHPDVTEDADGKNKFKAVGEAYKTLRHPDSRRDYTRQVASSPPVERFVWQDWIALPDDLYFALLPWPILTWLWWR